MSNEDNKKMKTLVELTGASAVLIGLIFVGLELRQNTAAVEASTLQNLTDGSNQFLTLLAFDPDMTRIMLLGGTDPDQLTELESAQLHLLIRGQWFRFQNTFLQWRRGTLSDEGWRVYESFVCRKTGEGLASTAEHVRFTTWDDHRPVLLSQFVEFVENCWSVNNSVAN